MFGIQNINNSVLHFAKAMPQKDGTSTNESTFAMSRNTYVETLPSIMDAQSKKKWLGNRDASQVTANRRNIEIGVGSLNATNAPMSFVSKDDAATRRALSRVRSGGSVAPAKKNANLNNAPTPRFGPVAPTIGPDNVKIYPNKNLYGIKSPVLFH